MNEPDEMDEIVKEFLIESQENLDQLDRDFVALEEAPGSKDLLTSIFRTIHTIKGTCGFLDFHRLERLTHAGENLLSRLREGELILSDDATTALLSMVDVVRSILSNIEATSEEGDGSGVDDALIQTLSALAEKGAAAAAPEPEPQPEPESSSPEPPPERSEVATTAEPGPIAKTEAPAPTTTANNQPVAATSPTPTEAPVAKASVADSTIRVDVHLLDRLMNLTGELVLARNQVLQLSSSLQEESIRSASQRLDLVTSELQEGIMKTRMQPIGTVWNKFPRVVRDLAKVCGKEVQVQMEGNETELDKSLIEAIKDPLTHIVRNSVDHGIETPETRVASGKPPTGNLLLRAYHEGGLINIEISDDGAGIEPERIKQKALEREVITKQQAATMSNDELVNLVFAPGFSTAEKVTNVSGRGVGMDVVKTNIDRISGTLDVRSVPGEGTTMRIKIPLTLAIIPALIITCHGERFAIPQVSLVELIRLEGSGDHPGIEDVHGAPVCRLRGKLLPVVFLGEELGLSSETDEEQSSSCNVVVLQAGDRNFGLAIGEVQDTEEIVVKPLGKTLRGTRSFAGATIMGDGEVALILDVLTLAQRAGVVSETSERGAGAASASEDRRASELTSLLVLDRLDGGRMAVPLSTVARLERIAAQKVEWTGQNEVVQYRNEILPLVRMAGMSGHATGGMAGGSDEAEKLDVVVYERDGKRVGIVVDRILDIVEHEIPETDIDSASPSSIVVLERVTELIDIEQLLRDLVPEWLEPTTNLRGVA